MNEIMKSENSIDAFGMFVVGFAFKLRLVREGCYVRQFGVRRE